jgi:poly(3-hydroxyalkanoate) synthetase
MNKYSYEKIEKAMKESDNYDGTPIEKIVSNAGIVSNFAVDSFKGFMKFSSPYFTATGYFSDVEKTKLTTSHPVESMISYAQLLDMNMGLANRGFLGSMKIMSEFANYELRDLFNALCNTVYSETGGENIESLVQRKLQTMNIMTTKFPKAIERAQWDFGFHFELGNNTKIAETPRFELYKIDPTEKGVKTDDSMKPVIIIPPYVLGANILAFLPGENRSYTHSYANQGIPTYIRILKDVSSNEAVQVMTPEDDVKDTKKFLEEIRKKHNKPVTLNGYCQGGFIAMCGLLTGEYDDLVDSMITCVSPMDGSRSSGLSSFLKKLPPRFNDLAYGTKTLPNGNKLADGNLMSWIYKLKSIEDEIPVVARLRDMRMFDHPGNENTKINTTAAALNYWLLHERTDIPLEIVKLSFNSYNIPVDKEGNLPVKIFGKKLNFKRIAEKKVKWLICYGEKDNLVEKSSALAPLDYVKATVSKFPKGHVSIATSWSKPDSKCALHTRFGEEGNMGPVYYHLELDKELAGFKKLSN